MAVAKAREYLTSYGVADRMREFEVSSATVELAALAVSADMLLNNDKVFNYRTA